MHRAIRAFLIIAYMASFLGSPERSLADDSPVLSLQESFSKVASAIKPAVVSITTIQMEAAGPPHEFYFGDPFEDFFHEFFGQSPSGRARPRPRPRRVEGMGSGVIIDPEGYILTNEHVIRGAEKIRVTLMEPEKKEYTGTVVGKDPRTDLAVIRIQSKEKFPSARLANSDQVRVGDWAVAVGSPFGLEQTVTVGVISAVRQSLEIEGHSYSDLLQTDAAINRGNSGGPLLNIHGEVIGVNTAIYAPTGVFAGIGFAIPSNRASEIMAQLIEKGRVIRGWMGVEIIPLNDVLARQFGVPSKQGVVVNHVMSGSPAEKAGLRRGDVLISFGGQKINSQEELVETVAKTAPEKRVTVEVWRAGKPLKLTLVTAERPEMGETSEGQERDRPAEAGAEGSKWGGARFASSAPELARRYGYPKDARGAVVIEIEPEGAAEKIGLMQGDLVASVNRQETPDPKTFVNAMKKVDLKQGVLLDIYRGERWMYLSYKEEE